MPYSRARNVARYAIFWSKFRFVAGVKDLTDIMSEYMLIAHPSKALACQMDMGFGSHGLSAYQGTKKKVKKTERLPTRSQGPEVL